MTFVGHDIVVMSASHSFIRHREHHEGVPNTEQEMLTVPEHLISPLVLIEVHVVLSFVSLYFM